MGTGRFSFSHVNSLLLYVVDSVSGIALRNKPQLAVRIVLAFKEPNGTNSLRFSIESDRQKCFD